MSLPDFIDCPDSSFRFLDDDFNYEKEHFAVIRDLEQDGWVKCPDWMPVGLNGYEWQCVNAIEAMMRPKPRLVDWLKYKVLKRSAS